MSNEKIREQFEGWHKSAVVGEPPHDKYDNGDYVNQHVQRYWVGWQASRAAIEVELPMFEGYQQHIVRELQAAFSGAADRAGLKVKP